MSQRYDLVTSYRAGSSIEEMEPAEDGEWVRWETLLEMHDRIKLDHAEWDKRRVAELKALRRRHSALEASLATSADAAHQIADEMLEEVAVSIDPSEGGTGKIFSSAVKRWAEAILALGTPPTMTKTVGVLVHGATCACAACTGI